MYHCKHSMCIYYTVNTLSLWTESSPESHLASHNNLDTCPDCSHAHFTVRSSWLTAYNYWQWRHAAEIHTCKLELTVPVHSRPSLFTAGFTASKQRVRARTMATSRSYCLVSEDSTWCSWLGLPCACELCDRQQCFDCLPNEILKLLTRLQQSRSCSNLWRLTQVNL